MSLDPFQLCLAESETAVMSTSSARESLNLEKRRRKTVLPPPPPRGGEPAAAPPDVAASLSEHVRAIAFVARCAGAADAAANSRDRAHALNDLAGCLARAAATPDGTAAAAAAAAAALGGACGGPRCGDGALCGPRLRELLALGGRLAFGAGAGGLRKAALAVMDAAWGAMRACGLGEAAGTAVAAHALAFVGRLVRARNAPQDDISAARVLLREDTAAWLIAAGPPQRWAFPLLRSLVVGLLRAAEPALRGVRCRCFCLCCCFCCCFV